MVENYDTKLADKAAENYDIAATLRQRRQHCGNGWGEGPHRHLGRRGPPRHPTEEAGRVPEGGFRDAVAMVTCVIARDVYLWCPTRELVLGELYLWAVRANRQAGGNAWKHHASDAVRERALARVSGGKALNSIRSKRCCSMSNRTSNW